MSALQFLAILGPAVAGVAFMCRLGWRAFKVLDAMGGLVQHELRPNGGGSLVDKVTRTEEKVDCLTDEVMLIKNEQAEVRRRLEAGELKFSEVEDRLDNAKIRRAT